MITLRDEIERQASIYEPAVLGADGGPASLTRSISAFGSGRNGFLALSGGLVGFGASSLEAGPANALWYRSWAARSSYVDLRDDDDLIGCDVFGDLILVRHDAVYRLDGELGDLERLAPSIDALLDTSIDEASDLFGGRGTRANFAGRVIGSDPLRLLPTTPFAVEGGGQPPYAEIKLSELLDRKVRFHNLIRGVADGGKVDLSFWSA